MKWHTEHDRFLQGTAWVSALIYGLPAAVLALIVSLIEGGDKYVVPTLIVYGIAALAHLMAYGFQAIVIQIKVTGDYWANSESDNS